jgi:hypothetical protein
VVRIRDPEKKSSRIPDPDPWGKKAPYPGSRIRIRNTDFHDVKIEETKVCLREFKLGTGYQYRYRVPVPVPGMCQIRILLKKEKPDNTKPGSYPAGYGIRLKNYWYR